MPCGRDPVDGFQILAPECHRFSGRKRGIWVDQLTHGQAIAADIPALWDAATATTVDREINRQVEARATVAMK